MKLYKYLTCNKNTLDGLINAYCWFSRPDDFNDPFDCALIRNKSLDEQIRQKRKIFCLSREKDNLLMWSHYSDSHAGFCIEYSPFSDEVINQLKNKGILPNEEKERLVIIQNATPVQYKTTEELNEYKSFFPADNVELVEQYRDYQSRGLEDEYLSKFIEGLYLKHESWSYEKEYRLIHEGEHRNIQPGQITAVYFGASMSSQDKRTIATLVKERFQGKCDLYQACFSEQKYELNFRKFVPKKDLPGLGLTF